MFEIIITETKVVTKKVGKDVEETVEVLKQTVEELDLSAVIKAINNIK